MPASAVPEQSPGFSLRFFKASNHLLLQVQAAAQEYQREFAAKDSAIQALHSEVEALQDMLHTQLSAARAAAKVWSTVLFPSALLVDAAPSPAGWNLSCSGHCGCCSSKLCDLVGTKRE